jgi:archaellum biogenesis ATPase FlaH
VPRVEVSSLQAINKLIGGLPLGTHVVVASPPMGGKTLLSLQLGWDVCSKTGGEITFIDTDGNFEAFLQQWQLPFATRFEKDVKVNIIKGTNVLQHQKGVPYMELRAFRAFGIEAYSKIGKQCEFQALGTCDPELGHYPNTKVLVIDSLSSIVKDAFHGLQSFGHRAACENMFLGLLKGWLHDHSDVVCIVNVHESVNPTKGWISISGGSAVLYNSKYALYISKIAGKNTGKLYIYRYPNVPPMSKWMPLKYSDIGITDGEAREVEESEPKIPQSP